MSVASYRSAVQCPRGIQGRGIKASEFLQGRQAAPVAQKLLWRPSHAGTRDQTAPRHGLTVRADLTETAMVSVLSAAPFVAVTWFARSEQGKEAAAELAASMDRLKANALKEEKQREAARKASPWFGAERPKWLGPLEYEYPSYLNGTVPGDYGFDILKLSQNREDFERYFNLEIIHARWAMLALVGAILPEILQRSGLVDFLEPVWWKVGYAKLQGEDLDYLGIPGLHIAGAQGVAIIAACQVFLMGGPEYARSCGINALEPLGIPLPGDVNFPGGILFDPLGLATGNAEEYEKNRVREIKNGRLAMVAWLGFFVQALVTREGPIKNFYDFLEDPAHNNITQYF
eukprot:jgi/Mesvir1/27586/Mv07331-RA.1